MPGLVHRHRERRDALVLGDVGVGAGEQDAPVGDVGVARPDLVAVDHVLVAVGDRGGAQRGEVGSGIGLAEPLAPPLRAVDQPGQEAVLDRVAAVVGDPLDQVAEARPRRRARGRHLLVEDHVEDGRQVLTAVARRPAQPEEPGVVQRGVPLGLAGPVLVVGRRRGQAGVVVGEPRAQPGPELGFRRRVTKVHSSPPTPSAHSRGACAQSRRAARRRRRTIAWRAARVAGRRGRSIPTCSRCRRAPGSRSRTRCARRARSTPWRRGRPRRASSGGRLSTAHDACSATLSDPSIRHCASASRCCTAWNEPTGTPYCWRSAAYATVTSRTPRISPTRSALVSARPSAAHCARSSAVSGRGLIRDRDDGSADRDHAHATSEVGACRIRLRCSGNGHAREVVPVAVGDEHVRSGGALGVDIDRVQRSGGDRTGHHRGLDQCGRERDDRAVSLRLTRGPPDPAEQVAGQDRTGKRNRGRSAAERVGDDRGFDSAGERLARPSTSAHRHHGARASPHRAPRPARRFVRVTSSRSATVDGRELASQVAGGAAQLGLFRRVPGVHSARR